MSYIALITDWQQNDYYLGAVKGFIYSQIADVNIIDINNGISKHNLFPAAFILKSCFYDFPEETIFIIGIQTVIEGENNYLCFGDNRSHSRDGREFGPVPKENIVGKAFFKYWPPAAVGLVPSVKI